jgi:hypothetical protein
MELDNLEARLVDKYGRSNISNKDVLSAALYFKVFEEYQDFVLRYSDLIEKLPTRAFLEPLKEDEEVEIELSKVRGFGGGVLEDGGGGGMGGGWKGDVCVGGGGEGGRWHGFVGMEGGGELSNV